MEKETWYCNDRDHEYVVEYLGLKNIYSSYHHYFNENMVKKHYQHFIITTKEKPFHIDFCFCPKIVIR